MKILGHDLAEAAAHDATVDYGIAILAVAAACVGVRNPLWAIILLLVLITIKI